MTLEAVVADLLSDCSIAEIGTNNADPEELTPATRDHPQEGCRYLARTMT